MEYATQYDSRGDRYTTRAVSPDLVLAPINPDAVPPPVFSRDASLVESPVTHLPVECLQYRESLQYKWYNTPKDGHLRISLGGDQAFYVMVTRFEHGEWRPISAMFHPDLAQGPHDIFIPPAKYGPPLDLPPAAGEFEISDLIAACDSIDSE